MARTWWRVVGAAQRTWSLDDERFRRNLPNECVGQLRVHSGHGSSESATRFLRAELLRLLSDLGVRSMLDVPCGDFNWMRLLDLPVDYFGADIVPQLIEANQKKYSRPGRAFGLLDAVKDPLPRADVVFSRDLLVHLSEQDIRSALRNIFDSGATYLVTTTFTSRGKNVDIPTGQWRVLNFQRPPFFFPRPIRLINEHCEEGDGLWADKCLGIWKISDLMTGAPAAAPSFRAATRFRHHSDRQPGEIPRRRGRQRTRAGLSGYRGHRRRCRLDRRDEG